MDENTNNPKTKWRNKLFREEDANPIFEKKENNFDIEYIEQKLKTIKNRKKYKSLDPDIEPLVNIYEPRDESFIEGLKMKKPKIKMKNISKSVKKISDVKKISKIKKLPKIKKLKTRKKKKSKLQSGATNTMTAIKNAINKMKYILFFIPNNLNKFIYDGTYQYATVMTNLDPKSKEKPPEPTASSTVLPTPTAKSKLNNQPPAQQKIKDDTNVLVQLIYIILLLFISIFVSYNLYDVVTFHSEKTYPINFNVFNQTKVTSYIYNVLQFFFKFSIYPTNVIDTYLLKENSLKNVFEKMEFKIIAFFILFLFSFLFLILVFVPNLNTKLNYVTYLAFGGLILYQYIKFVVEGIDIMVTNTDTNSEETDSEVVRVVDPVVNPTALPVVNALVNPIAVPVVNTEVLPAKSDGHKDILDKILSEGLNIDPEKILESLKKLPPGQRATYIKQILEGIKNNEALNQLTQLLTNELSILAIKTTSPILYYVIFGIYCVLVAVIAFISIKISVSVFILYLLIYCFFAMGIYGEHFMSIFDLWKDKRDDIDKMFKTEYDNLIKKDKKDMTTTEQIAEFLYNHRYKFTFILVSIYGAIRSGVSLHSNVLKCINVLFFTLILIGNLYVIIHSYDDDSNPGVTSDATMKRETSVYELSGGAQNWFNKIIQPI